MKGLVFDELERKYSHNKHLRYAEAEQVAISWYLSQRERRPLEPLFGKWIGPQPSITCSTLWLYMLVITGPNQPAAVYTTAPLAILRSPPWLSDSPTMRGHFILPLHAQWAKSGGKAVLLQFSDFTKYPMHDLNRLFCWNSCDCEFWPYIMYLLEFKHEKVHTSDDKSLKMNHATFALYSAATTKCSR